MDIESYRNTVQFLMVAGFVITFIVWVGYSVAAPWYKYSAGRYIWGLLTSLTGLFTVFVARYILEGYPFQRELILITLMLYCFAMLGMGYGIYKAQILRYHKAKFVQSERERHRQN